MSRTFHDEGASRNIVVTLRTHREFKPTYFRRYNEHEEHDFVTGFQSDRDISIGKNMGLSIRQRLGHNGTRQKEITIENRKDDRNLAARKLMGPGHHRVFMYIHGLSVSNQK
jgi:hypothetical protein